MPADVEQSTTDSVPAPSIVGEDTALSIEDIESQQPEQALLVVPLPKSRLSALKEYIGNKYDRFERRVSTLAWRTANFVYDHALLVFILAITFLVFYVCYFNEHYQLERYRYAKAPKDNRSPEEQQYVETTAGALVTYSVGKIKKFLGALKSYIFDSTVPIEDASDQEVVAEPSATILVFDTAEEATEEDILPEGLRAVGGRRILQFSTQDIDACDDEFQDCLTAEDYLSLEATTPPPIITLYANVNGSVDSRNRYLFNPTLYAQGGTFLRVAELVGAPPWLSTALRPFDIKRTLSVPGSFEVTYLKTNLDSVMLIPCSGGMFVVDALTDAILPFFPSQSGSDVYSVSISLDTTLMFFSCEAAGTEVWYIGNGLANAYFIMYIPSPTNPATGNPSLNSYTYSLSPGIIVRTEDPFVEAIDITNIRLGQAPVSLNIFHQITYYQLVLSQTNITLLATNDGRVLFYDPVKNSVLLDTATNGVVLGMAATNNTVYLASKTLARFDINNPRNATALPSYQRPGFSGTFRGITAIENLLILGCEHLGWSVLSLGENNEMTELVFSPSPAPSSEFQLAAVLYNNTLWTAEYNIVRENAVGNSDFIASFPTTQDIGKYNLTARIVDASNREIDIAIEFEVVSSQSLQDPALVTNCTFSVNSGQPIPILQGISFSSMVSNFTSAFAAVVSGGTLDPNDSFSTHYFRNTTAAGFSGPISDVNSDLDGFYVIPNPNSAKFKVRVAGGDQINADIQREYDCEGVDIPPQLEPLSNPASIDTYRGIFIPQLDIPIGNYVNLNTTAFRNTPQAYGFAVDVSAIAANFTGSVDVLNDGGIPPLPFIRISNGVFNNTNPQDTSTQQLHCMLNCINKVTGDAFEVPIKFDSNPPIVVESLVNGLPTYRVDIAENLFAAANFTVRGNITTVTLTYPLGVDASANTFSSTGYTFNNTTGVWSATGDKDTVLNLWRGIKLDPKQNSQADMLVNVEIEDDESNIFTTSVTFKATEVPSQLNALPAPEPIEVFRGISISQRIPVSNYVNLNTTAFMNTPQAYSFAINNNANFTGSVQVVNEGIPPQPYIYLDGFFNNTDPQDTSVQESDIGFTCTDEVTDEILVVPIKFNTKPPIVIQTLTTVPATFPVNTLSNLFAAANCTIASDTATINLYFPLGTDASHNTFGAGATFDENTAVWSASGNKDTVLDLWRGIDVQPLLNSKDPMLVRVEIVDSKGNKFTTTAQFDAVNIPADLTPRVTPPTVTTLSGDMFDQNLDLRQFFTGADPSTTYIYNIEVPTDFNVTGTPPIVHVNGVFHANSPNTPASIKITGKNPVTKNEAAIDLNYQVYPRVTLKTPTTGKYKVNTADQKPLADVVISGGIGLIRSTITSDPLAGTWSIAPAADLTIGFTQGVWDITGDSVLVQQAVNNAKFTPTKNNEANVDIKITAQDLSNLDNDPPLEEDLSLVATDLFQLPTLFKIDNTTVYLKWYNVVPELCSELTEPAQPGGAVACTLSQIGNDCAEVAIIGNHVSEGGSPAPCCTIYFTPNVTGHLTTDTCGFTMSAHMVGDDDPVHVVKRDFFLNIVPPPPGQTDPNAAPPQPVPTPKPIPHPNPITPSVPLIPPVPINVAPTATKITTTISLGSNPLNAILYLTIPQNPLIQVDKLGEDGSCTISLNVADFGSTTDASTIIANIIASANPVPQDPTYSGPVAFVVSTNDYVDPPQQKAVTVDVPARGYTPPEFTTALSTFDQEITANTNTSIAIPANVTNVDSYTTGPLLVDYGIYTFNNGLLGTPVDWYTPPRNLAQNSSRLFDQLGDIVNLWLFPPPEAAGSSVALRLVVKSSDQKNNATDFIAYTIVAPAGLPTSDALSPAMITVMVAAATAALGLIILGMKKKCCSKKEQEREEKEEAIQRISRYKRGIEFLQNTYTRNPKIDLIQAFEGFRAQHPDYFPGCSADEENEGEEVKTLITGSYYSLGAELLRILCEQNPNIDPIQIQTDLCSRYPQYFPGISKPNDPPDVAVDMGVAPPLLAVAPEQQDSEKSLRELILQLIDSATDASIAEDGSSSPVTPAKTSSNSSIQETPVSVLNRLADPAAGIGEITPPPSDGSQNPFIDVHARHIEFSESPEAEEKSRPSSTVLDPGAPIPTLVIDQIDGVNLPSAVGGLSADDHPPSDVSRPELGSALFHRAMERGRRVLWLPPVATNTNEVVPPRSLAQLVTGNSPILTPPLPPNPQESLMQIARNEALRRKVRRIITIAFIHEAQAQSQHPNSPRSSIPLHLHLHQLVERMREQIALSVASPTAADEPDQVPAPREVWTEPGASNSGDEASSPAEINSNL